jgi:hypothetical protein
MSGEIRVTQGKRGVVIVDYGDGRQREYPSMAEALQAAHQAAQKDGSTVRVTRTPD